jgi:hypothetical protein
VPDVVGLCDEQYDASEVATALASIVSETATLLPLIEGCRPALLTTIECAISFFINARVPTAGLIHMALNHVDSFYVVGDNAEEHLIFVLLLSELSVLDHHLLRYSPFVTALAILYYANLVMHHYSRANVMIGPYGHVISCSNTREVKGLGEGNRSYLSAMRGHMQSPFGSKLFENFVLSMSMECRMDVVKCVGRLWMLHSDFVWHTFYKGPTTGRNGSVKIVKYHMHIFRGLVRRFAQQHSCRYRVWEKLGPVPEAYVKEKSCELFIVGDDCFNEGD